MAKQIKARRAAAKSSPKFNGRDLWLASLGAVAMTRKQGIKLYDTMINEGRSLQNQVVDRVSAFGEQINDRLADVRAKVEGAIAPVRARAVSTYSQIAKEVQTRLQPVLAKFGVKVSKPRATKRVAKSTRKPAQKRTVRRARKAA
ncbi:phasin family protein [Pseudomarimonas arenosa]|uniref:Phasin family protein n=1 Tax=Pseudomarimonas arenosa TaxID=2774145 RepID=A0AAW3ZJY5_9GAMM|nr:phasin family protein [Pseudomarimonas arenosa]MBD8526306.1 phasin family protein [Pseudomarimonas arenosa]